MVNAVRRLRSNFDDAKTYTGAEIRSKMDINLKVNTRECLEVECWTSRQMWIVLLWCYFRGRVLN
jgi:hypothetical protein